MKIKKLGFLQITLICFVVGILMFLVQRNWLIVYWNFGLPGSTPQTQKEEISKRKKVRIYFGKDSKFRHEDTVIIWNNDNKAENLKHLVNAWLGLLLDEGLISKKIELESVIVTAQENEIFISFSHTFPWQEWSIFKKYKLVDSLLKSINQADKDIRLVNFLVNYKPMEDAHLSFLQAWPVDGFE